MSGLKFVNSYNLRWARARTGLAISDVYKKNNWKSGTGKIERWEKGESFPTVSELRSLGKIYKRPWVFFIMEQNANELNFTTLSFRKIFKEGQKPSPHLFAFLNELKYRQEFLLEFDDELDLTKNLLVGSGRNISDPKYMAEHILTYAEIDSTVFRNKQKRREGFNYLLECLERKNIFVSLTTNHYLKGIPLEEMRGVLLNSERVPFIGINIKNESYGARIFTVFHELTHLFRGDSFVEGVEITKIDFRNKSKNETESFCNKVAAYILVPDSELEKIEKPIGKEKIRKLCIQLKVNLDPLLYRMQDFGLLTREEVIVLQKEIKEEKIEAEKTPEEGKSKKGGQDGGLQKLSQNGKAFIHAVNTLYSQGEINFTQVLDVLDVKASIYKKHSPRI